MTKLKKRSLYRRGTAIQYFTVQRPHGPQLYYLLLSYGAFTLDVKSVLNENLGGILGGTQCYMDDIVMLSEC